MCGGGGGWLTWPSTKPRRRKRMTEKIERQHGMVTPNIILSFFFLAECTSVCVCVCVCVRTVVLIQALCWD